MAGLRIVDRLGDRGDGRLVEYELDVLARLKAYLRIADVGFEQLDLSGQMREVVTAPGREIVYDPHPVAELNERTANSARKDLFNYAMADGYARMFRNAGFAEEVDVLRSRQADRDRDGALAAISERMIQAIDFVGSEEEVGAFVRAYVEAGVEHPVLMPMPWGEDRFDVTEQTMRAAIRGLAGD